MISDKIFKDLVRSKKLVKTRKIDSQTKKIFEDEEWVECDSEGYSKKEKGLRLGFLNKLEPDIQLQAMNIVTEGSKKLKRVQKMKKMQKEEIQRLEIKYSEIDNLTEKKILEFYKLCLMLTDNNVANDAVLSLFLLLGVRILEIKNLEKRCQGGLVRRRTQGDVPSDCQVQRELDQFRQEVQTSAHFLIKI